MAAPQEVEIAGDCWGIWGDGEIGANVSQSLFRNTLIYGIGDVFTKGLSLAAVVVYARILTPEQFGLWNYLLVIGSFFLGISSILSFGSDSAYTYTFQHAKTDEERQTVTTTAFVIAMIWGGSIVSLAVLSNSIVAPLLFDENISQPFWIIFAFIALVSTINTFISQILRNSFFAMRYVLWEFIVNSFTVLLTLLGMKWSSTPILGGSLGTLLGGSIALFLRIKYTLPFFNFKLSKLVAKDIFKMGLPFIPAYFAGWLFSFSDRFILGQYSSFHDIAVYSLAASFVTPLYFLQIALGLAWSPYLIHIFTTTPHQLNQIINKMLTLIIMIGCIGVSGLYLFTPYILKFLFSEDFRGTSELILPLAIGNAFYVTTLVTSSGIVLHKKTVYFPIFMLAVATIKTIFILFLLPQIGIYSAAVATLIGMALLTFLYALYTQKYIKIHYEFKSSAIFMATTFIVTILLKSYWDNVSITGFFVKIIAILLLALKVFYDTYTTNN